MNSTTTHIGKQELCGQSVDVVADSVIDNPVLPCCIPRGNPANSCKGSLRLKRGNNGCREILAYRNVGVECPEVLVANKGCEDCCKQGISTPFCIDGCKVTYYRVDNCELITFDAENFIGFYCMDELSLAPPCSQVTDGYDQNGDGEWQGQGGQLVNPFNHFDIFIPWCCDLIIKLRRYDPDAPVEVGDPYPIGYQEVFEYVRIPKMCSVGEDFMKKETGCFDRYYAPPHKWNRYFDQFIIIDNYTPPEGVDPPPPSPCRIQDIVYNLFDLG